MRSVADPAGAARAGEIRFRLVQQVLREGQKRGAARFHVACADADDNVELFMQAGFARYGEERVLYRPPDQPLPKPWTDEAAATAADPPRPPGRRAALMQLYASVTPAPVQRLEGFRIPDWERQGSNWRVPRSSLAPILRFADIDAYVLERRPTASGSMASSRSASRARTSPTTCGCWAGPDVDLRR